MVHIWPIGGGKGGSGKSFLTSSLGRLLAESGKRTLLVDLDLGAANLHTLIDVPYPTKSLSDFIRKKKFPSSRYRFADSHSQPLPYQRRSR